MQLAHYLGLLHAAEERLAETFAKSATPIAQRSTSFTCASDWPSSATPTPSA